MGDYVSKTYRLNSESVEAFKQFCDEQGVTQSQGFEYMMQILEVEKTKENIPERRTEIDDFTAMSKAMVASFIHSVQMNQHAELRIREEFASQMQSKDQTILDYQIKLKDSEKENTLLRENERLLMITQGELTEYQNRLGSKEKELISLKQQTEKQLTDKDSINNMLTEKLAAADAKANAYDALQAELQEVRNQVRTEKEQAREKAHQDILEYERLLRRHEKEIEEVKTKVREELQSQLRATQDASRADLEALRESHRVTLENAEKARTEALMKTEREHSAEMQELTAKLATAEAELRLLRDSIKSRDQSGSAE